MEKEFDIEALNIRLSVKSINGCCVLYLPKDFCSMIGIDATGEQVELVIHKVIKGGKCINLTHLVKI